MFTNEFDNNRQTFLDTVEDMEKHKQLISDLKSKNDVLDQKLNEYEEIISHWEKERKKILDEKEGEITK